MRNLREIVFGSKNRVVNPVQAEETRDIPISPAEGVEQLKLIEGCMTLLKKPDYQFDSKTLYMFSTNMIKLLGGREFGPSQKSNELVHQDKEQGETAITFYSDSRGFEYHPVGERIKIECGDTIEKIRGEKFGSLPFISETTIPNDKQQPVDYYSFFANSQRQIQPPAELEDIKELTGQQVQAFCKRVLQIYQSQISQNQPT